MQLFCLPFAGGNSFFYRPFAKALEPYGIEAVLLDYPGHGIRSGERMVDTFEELTADVLSQIALKQKGEFALFGHSLGGYLTFEIAETGQKRADFLPKKIYISSVFPPSEEKKAFPDPEKDPVAFWDFLVKMGGLPVEILSNASAVSYFRPILERDFKILINAKNELHQISTPATVFYGRAESCCDRIKEWKNWLTGDLTIIPFDGGHFYLAAAWDKIADNIGRDLK